MLKFNNANGFSIDLRICLIKIETKHTQTQLKCLHWIFGNVYTNDINVLEPLMHNNEVDAIVTIVWDFLSTSITIK